MFTSARCCCDAVYSSAQWQLVFRSVRHFFLGWNIGIYSMPFGTEKLEWRGYPMVNFDDTFIRFDTTHERDRQTPHDDIGRAYA